QPCERGLCRSGVHPDVRCAKAVVNSPDTRSAAEPLVNHTLGMVRHLANDLDRVSSGCEGGREGVEASLRRSDLGREELCEDQNAHRMWRPLQCREPCTCGYRFAQYAGASP